MKQNEQKFRVIHHDVVETIYFHYIFMVYFIAACYSLLMVKFHTQRFFKSHKKKYKVKKHMSLRPELPERQK